MRSTIEDIVHTFQEKYADIAAEIRSAALELATIFIVEARTFTTLFPAEVFSHMETTLKRRWIKEI